MSELSPRGSKYDDAMRRECAIQYGITGSLTKVHKATGVPISTIGDWAKQDWFIELTAEARNEKMQEMRGQFAELVELANAKALELIPNSKNAKESALVACMALDKLRLIDGLPTSIRGSDDSTDKLMRKFEAIAQTYQEKQAKVVATSHRVVEDE